MVTMSNLQSRKILAVAPPQPRQQLILMLSIPRSEGVASIIISEINEFVVIMKTVEKITDDNRTFPNDAMVAKKINIFA